MIEPLRVFLAAPTYDGWRHDGNAKAIHGQASAREDTEIAVGMSGTSLLAHSFNLMLANALDLRDAGEIDYFAMLHADIEPEPAFDAAGRFAHGWLDMLHERMAEIGADLISAVVPIKEPHDPDAFRAGREDRRTSVAIFDADNPWTPKRFVRMKDRRWLPHTFTAREALCAEGEELCVNTGCLLMDLRRGWWDSFAFEIRDRIVRGEGDRREAQVRPEDWELSRHVTRSGGTVAATWAVRVIHHGSYSYRNY